MPKLDIETMKDRSRNALNYIGKAKEELTDIERALMDCDNYIAHPSSSLYGDILDLRETKKYIDTAIRRLQGRG